MKRSTQKIIKGGAVAAVCASLIASALADEKKEVEPAKKPSEAESQRPEPKDLSPNVKKGLAYLKETQHESGGWGQGGGWRTNAGKGGGRVEGENVEDPPDIGNTAVALLAFLRAGESFEEGEYSGTMTMAANFLLSEIGKNEDDTLYVTHIRDTQLQSKIGQYVDTFLAALVLSELKDKLPSPSMEEIRAALLARIVDKIESHQKDDGTFEGNGGWAAVLSQGIASKSLNRAWLAGGGVSDRALRADAANNASGVDPGSSEIKAVAGKPSSAGVDLYRYAAQLGGLQEQANINTARKKRFGTILKSEVASEEQKKQALEELEAIDKNDADADTASAVAGEKLKDESFVAGFGNNGGEEFLSYMNVSEAMYAKGGSQWKEWDDKMAETVNGAQNADGSWAGKHCITGRTFCTATALLTLMADRAPIPEANEGEGDGEGDDAPSEAAVDDASTESGKDPSKSDISGP